MPIREMLNRPSGKAGVGVIAVLAIGLCYGSIKDSVGSSSPSSSSRDRMFVDSTSGKAFEHDVSAGKNYPVVAPTGGHTG